MTEERFQAVLDRIAAAPMPLEGDGMPTSEQVAATIAGIIKSAVAVTAGFGRLPWHSDLFREVVGGLMEDLTNRMDWYATESARRGSPP